MTNDCLTMLPSHPVSKVSYAWPTNLEGHWVRNESRSVFIPASTVIRLATVKRLWVYFVILHRNKKCFFGMCFYFPIFSEINIQKSRNFLIYGAQCFASRGARQKAFKISLKYSVLNMSWFFFVFFSRCCNKLKIHDFDLQVVSWVCG